MMTRQQRRAAERAAKKAENRSESDLHMPPEIVQNPDGTTTIRQATFFGRAAKFVRGLNN